MVQYEAPRDNERDGWVRTQWCACTWYATPPCRQRTRFYELSPMLMYNFITVFSFLGEHPMAVYVPLPYAAVSLPRPLDISPERTGCGACELSRV